MKNYYEILEVNPKASQEVIEKAYKVLVRKYHPDLYSGEKQQYAKKKTQEMNEAYHVLSDEFLREQYNKELERQQIKYKIENSQEQKVKTETRAKKSALQQRKVGSLGAIIELTKELVHNLAKSKEKREEIKQITKNDILAIILTVISLILIGIILWFIPFTNGWMRELLFENPLFNWIGSLFSR